MKPMFPYPTFFGDVDLDIVAVTVDGAQLPYSKISRNERTVALHETGRENWDVATLQVRATLPEQEIAGGPWTDIACLAVLREKATNARATAPLVPDSDGRWQGSIDLRRDRHRTRALLGLAVVGTVEGVPGRIIGSTDEGWNVDLHSATPVRQREIVIVKADFREGPHEWLRPYADSPWIVVTTEEEIPTVYLNAAGVEGLIDVLYGTGGGREEKLVREMMASQIALDAWTVMFHTAIGDLEVDEDDTPLMPTGWKGSVLRAMLPDVLPGRQLTDALYEISERSKEGFGWAEIQTSIQYAAGRRGQVARKLTTAVRNLRATERGSA
jgi:hypothetical protein